MKLGKENSEFTPLLHYKNWLVGQVQFRVHLISTLYHSYYSFLSDDLLVC